MSKLDKFKRKDKNSDNVWSSISDLMSGLMIVFLFTSVIFMSKVIDENTNIKKQQQTVENIVITYEDSKENIYEDLYNEFEGDMDNWHMEIDKDKIILFFKNAEDGFNRDNGIIGFEIAGKDMRFHKANATIDANKKTVIISAPGVKAPIAARYGFRNFQIGNLQNVQGLPVLPFRTDK